MTINEIRLVVSFPDPMLFPNRPGHWSKKSKLASVQKSEAALVALSELNRLGVDAPRWQEADVYITAFKRSRRTIDRDNFMNAMKRAWDGFEKAGVIENDSGFHYHSVQWEVDPKNPRVEILIRRKL